jgi:hypothetical protein
MESFKKYLAESTRTYSYRLKIVGEVDQKLLQLIEINLQKFSIVKMGDPRTTPIQKTLKDFPDSENDRVTIVDVEFRYPVIEPFVKQMARLLGMDENRVRMVSMEHDDADAAQAEQFANIQSHSPLLNHEELEDQGKEASKEYADSYLGRIKKQTESDKMEMKFDAPKTKIEHDPYKPIKMDKIGQSSPMSSTKKQPLPSTGASR